MSFLFFLFTVVESVCTDCTVLSRDGTFEQIQAVWPLNSFSTQFFFTFVSVHERSLSCDCVQFYLGKSYPVYQRTNETGFFGQHFKRAEFLFLYCFLPLKY